MQQKEVGRKWMNSSIRTSLQSASTQTDDFVRTKIADPENIKVCITRYIIFHILHVSFLGLI